MMLDNVNSLQKVHKAGIERALGDASVGEVMQGGNVMIWRLHELKPAWVGAADAFMTGPQASC